MDEKIVHQKIEQFFAHVKVYQELHIESLANYIGIDVHTLLCIFPRREWQARKDEWTLQKLREAIDEIYPSTKIQQDFSVRRIARIVGVDPSVLNRLIGNEFQHRRATLPTSYYDENFIRPALEQFFAKASAYEELRLEVFAHFVGLHVTTVIHILQRVFPSEWQRRKDEWVLQRLRRSMSEVAQSAQTQADFSIQRILVHAEVPRCGFSRLAAEEFFQWKAILATRLASEDAFYQHETEEILFQATVRFFAQAEAYHQVTVEQFTDFAGQDLQTVSSVYPAQRWNTMRDEWALKRVQKAMNDVYQQAKCQRDFSALRVAQSADIHPNVFYRLARDEYYQLRATLPITILPAEPKEREILHKKLQQCFEQAKTHEELRIENMAACIGIDLSTLLQNFSFRQLQMMRDEWCLQRIHLAMDEVYRASALQSDFSRPRIAEKAGVPISVINRLALEEFRQHQATLPTAPEKLFAALKTLVDANIPLADFSQKRVYELAGVGPIVAREEFIKAYREAYIELMRRQSQKLPVPIPPPSEEHDPCYIAGQWIDLASHCWKMRLGGSRGSILKRDRLRNDLAEIAWFLLQEEVRSGEFTAKTIIGHYNGFINVGELLGDDVPDISLISLEALQHAWLRYPGTPHQKKGARIALQHLVGHLLVLSEQDATHGSYEELLRINVWLSLGISCPAGKRGEEFLSDAELTTLLQGCLGDIQQGITFAEKNPDLLMIDTRRRATESAHVVIQWAVALMVLLMAFTGLRRQSVVLLEVDDWMQVRPGLFALIWRHGKKREENLAVLPAVIAHQLDLYTYYTAPVRKTLGTKCVFFNGSPQGLWTAMSSSSSFSSRLDNLTKRYHLERNGVPLWLGSTLLRRTFTTRALYEGQSLEALRLQLGHAHVQTTIIYAHHDRLEHPNQVREPLDLYGRQSLTLWHAPLMLDQLPLEERLSLLKTKVERQQDVGYCRHHYCIKVKSGSPPPCSLCEHLVTGPEFLSAWKQEQARREQGLQLLAANPDTGLLLAQMKCQFEHFQANFAFIQKSCNV